MKCQILFSGKNKKNISKCRLLKILPRVLSVKTSITREVRNGAGILLRFCVVWLQGCLPPAQGGRCAILTQTG